MRNRVRITERFPLFSPARSSSLSSARGRRPDSGFTLIELLVVITIILLVSAVALPTVLPALSHRQVSEGRTHSSGRPGGARDSAIKNNRPAGIRLLHDPAWPISYPSGSSTIDTTLPLASNRIIPIASAPDYTEGLVTPVNSPSSLPAGFTLPYPSLMVVESVLDPNSGLPNAPTSWFWNVRVGDKIQLNNAGPWYTVVGPMAIPAAGTTISNTFYANPELFVNVGPPGTTSDLKLAQGSPATVVNPEYLYLVNGQDDNGNGWIDEGFDGIDNNANGSVDEYGTVTEWETEAWLGALSISPNIVESNVPYTIRRRPAPTGNAREVMLPTNVVIDLTTWGTTQERSQLPVNPYNGYVDILIYPNGTVVPNTIYSTPAVVGLSGSFVHFWVAERGDVTAPSVSATAAPYLPVGVIQSQLLASNPYSGAQLQGEYRLVSLTTRTGQLTTNENVLFDNPANPANGTAYNTNYPFIPAQQGLRGGQ